MTGWLKIQSSRIQRVDTNRCRGDPLQFLGSTGVVEMAVSEENILYLKAQTGDLFDNTENLIAGINDKALFCVFTAQYIAICLIRTDS
jgi:hypothetical protein